MSGSRVQCPRCPLCANETVYVEVLEPSIVTGFDECQCRCGKCGGRFSISTSRDAWFLPYLLGVAESVSIAPAAHPETAPRTAIKPSP
jgi:hypothetical protein